MLFHAKALELYTLAYQHTMAIDEQEQTQVCVYACVRACVCACVRVCVHHLVCMSCM